jgi:hypothetical protein
LILGTLFATTLNLAIVSRFVWTESFTPGWSSCFAAVACGIWLASFGYSVWWVWRLHPEGHRGEIDGLFREAVEAYLQGRWQDSRVRFERILAIDENDADALMLLGTLFVRTDQSNLARRALRQCLEAESGGKWRWEVQQTLARLGEGAPQVAKTAIGTE